MLKKHHSRGSNASITLLACAISLYPVISQVGNHAMTGQKAQLTAQAMPFKVKAVGAVLLPFQEPLKPGADESD